MLTVRDAYEVVKKHNPKMTAFSCYEYESYYAFGLEPEDLEEGDMFANSTVYKVDKLTGKHSTVYFTDISDKPVREIDVRAIT